ncbi:MAG: DNA repair protein RadC [Pseudomonadota bacterium]
MSETSTASRRHSTTPAPAPDSGAGDLAIAMHGVAATQSKPSRAAELLQHAGGLRALFRAAPNDAAHWLSDAERSWLSATTRLLKAWLAETIAVGQTLSSPADTEAFLHGHLRDLEHEVFCGIFLDTRHRVLQFEILFRGTIDGTSVYPREVIKRALALNAAALIVAHNHPSGVAEPSQADNDITHRLSSALALIDVRLLDHIIVGDGQTTSLAGRGLI